MVVRQGDEDKVMEAGVGERREFSERV